MQKVDLIRRAHVCREGQDENQCRYLINQTCLKHHIDARQVIDFRVAKGTLVATGDHCEGLPLVRRNHATKEPAL